MRKLFAQLILLGDSTAQSSDISILDRIKYAGQVIAKLAPIAFILDQFTWWFGENKQFGTFMCIALVINAAVGAWMHLKNRSFTFLNFFFRNGLMIAVVSVTYIMLEMLRYTAGDNVAGEIFKVVIQLMSLLYPTSKVIKNIFILSKGKYPPEFIMRKIYNFEKNGDLEKLFSSKAEDLIDIAGFEEEKQKLLKNEKGMDGDS